MARSFVQRLFISSSSMKIFTTCLCVVRENYYLTRKLQISRLGASWTAWPWDHRIVLPSLAFAVLTLKPLGNIREGSLRHTHIVQLGVLPSLPFRRYHLLQIARRPSEPSRPFLALSQGYRCDTEVKQTLVLRGIGRLPRPHNMTKKAVRRSKLVCDRRPSVIPNDLHFYVVLSQGLQRL